MDRVHKKSLNDIADRAAVAVAIHTPDYKAVTAQLSRTLEENNRLSKILGLVESYHAAVPKPPVWMLPHRKINPKAAIACLQLSDLHLDEVVNPAEVGGLNAFNRTIGEQRLKLWAIKACEMGERHKHAWDGAIIFWGGDMVSGSIHEELRETNADVLPGTMVYWAPRIAAAIKMVADYYGNVSVYCVTGNHGRLSVRMPSKRRGRNSWDWLLSQMVQAHFAQDKRVKFTVAEGSYLFVPVYDKWTYLTHGDEVSGGNGWAGIWSPLGNIARRGAELAAAHELKISYCVIGHWHHAVLAHQQGIVCSGALKGWDEYAASMRFRPEPATQNWWTVSPETGVTLQAPLFLQDRKAENW